MVSSLTMRIHYMEINLIVVCVGIAAGRDLCSAFRRLEDDVSARFVSQSGKVRVWQQGNETHDSFKSLFDFIEYKDVSDSSGARS